MRRTSDHAQAQRVGQGIGHAAFGAGLAAHEARARNEGTRGYKIFPAGQRLIYSPIQYIEPREGNNLRALGYDPFSEPVRRAALLVVQVAELRTRLADASLAMFGKYTGSLFTKARNRVWSGGSECVMPTL